LKERYYSLDVFRGMTVAFMILVNNPAKWDAANIFKPLEHAPWHGCTPTDLVFPFFLFAVGNAMAFVMPRFQQAGNDWLFWKKITKRSLLIFGIGFLLLAWAPWLRYNEHNQLVFRAWEYDVINCKGEATPVGIRILGVLQRIALCYFFAAIFVYFTRQRGTLVISAFLLLLYWIICRFGTAHPDPYSAEGWAGRSIDIFLNGKQHIITEKVNGVKIPFDPEGWLSTIPAVVSVMLGYLVGDYIQRKGKSYEMLSNLFVAGAVMAAAGLLWGEVFPLNKKIWTSSYVVYTTGVAILTISVLIYLVEFKALNKIKGLGNITGGRLVWLLAPVFVYIVWKAGFGIPENVNRFALMLLVAIPVALFFIMLVAGNYFMPFFDAFGKNPLFIFVLAGFIPRLLSLVRIPAGGTKECPVYTTPLSWLGEKICIPAFSNPKTGSLMYSLILIMFFWAIAWWMDKRKLYVKV
jgi:predicted acyltransferase